MAVAEAAVEARVLSRFFGTFDLRSLPTIPASRSVDRALARLARRSYAPVPIGQVEQLARDAELAHLLARRLRTRPGVATRSMYWTKDRFDQAVESRLPAHHASVFLGMWGSAARSLRRARDLGRVGALNFVNSHPDVHNELLRTYAGLHVPSHELVPPEVARRVGHELEAAAVVLVPSVFVRRQLLDRGTDPSRIAVIPYGVDAGAFRPGPRQLEPSSGRRPRCLYVGQLSFRKGIHVLVEAAKRSPTVDFILVGPSVSPQVLAGHPPNLRWVGPTGHGKLDAVMQEADIFLLPTIEDSYGLVVLEAMASGLPTIVTSHAGAAESVEPGVTGLVIEPGDPDALADAVERLAGDAELRSRLGSSARRAVSEHHDWTGYGQRVLEALARRVPAGAS